MGRAAIIVLDGVGAGPAPDTPAYGEAGSDTLGNVARAVGGLQLPNLERLGLGRCHDGLGIAGLARDASPTAAHGIAQPASAGKDRTAGHWEICGVLLEEAFRTYPRGFPVSLLEEFARRTGRGWLGNKTASGTEIIQELGEEHQRTGKWIVYTSADSVFQVAAHEETIQLEELYNGCRIARQILTGKDAVGRVIARPFIGSPGHYERPQDLLILTSDHGCDPTTPSTDHSREHALLVAYVEGKNAGGRIHEGEFADVGATVNRWLGGKAPSRGIPGQLIVEH